MDEYWLYFVLPMIAAAVVAVVEWRRYREGSEHGEKIVGLEYRVSALENVVNNHLDAPDLSPVTDRVDRLERAVSAHEHAIKAMEE